MLDPAMTGQYDYKREELDHYPTPREVTIALMGYLHLQRTDEIWEPACGTGSMSEVLETYAPTISSDIKDYGFGCSGIDFFDMSGPPVNTINHIVTNPPYGDIAEKFVRHAIKLMQPHDGTVAMLMRNEWDCAKSRRDLFNEMPFHSKLVLTWRPRWIAGSTGAPRHNYAWYIWKWFCGYKPEPRIFHVAKPSC